MLDRWTLEWIKPSLTKTARALDKIGLSANQVSIIGFLIGLMAVPALYLKAYITALVIIIINRILDGLDGTIARMRKPTDAGGFLDITFDFVFYSAVIVGFALADPEQNAVAAAVLIFSFVGTGSSFLAFAVMAAKHNIKSITYPQKSLYYLGGLTEGTETIAFFVVFCLFPDYFPILAFVFAGLCGLTTVLRIYGGYQTLASHLKDKDPKKEDN